ncbi:MAG: sce7726 family protein [Candidatus Competibacteraceae bacterium]|nr:sce7726 family protein [Candidatus Competibacteraceae bacterium]
MLKVRLRDCDVRDAVHRKVLADHHCEPETLVLDELGLQNGACRVDIAVINGFIHGFEIKSDSDTLDRLPRQIDLYGEVLDRATIVVGERHSDTILHFLPSWWGIKVAERGRRGAVHLHDVRRPCRNSGIIPEAVAALLWSSEAIDILEKYGAARGVRGKRRELQYQRLAEVLPIDILCEEVRLRLKERSGWRGNSVSASRQT